MLLLWPERESLQLPGLLARAAATNAGYLRAVLAFWRESTGKTQRARIEAERTLLAPARRRCGLAANDAEETLDHALLEHSIPLNPERARTERLNRAALTFTTYLRRLSQTITALSALAEVRSTNSSQPDIELSGIIDNYAQRLDAVSTALQHHSALHPAEHQPLPFANEQLRRLDRQVDVLERTANDLAGIT
jgi:hypothetical protein